MNRQRRNAVLNALALAAIALGIYIFVVMKYLVR